MALPSEAGPQYQIQQLSARHQSILQMIAIGMKNVDIAERLGITAQSVSIVRNSQLGREKLNSLVQRTDDNVVDLKKRFEELGPLAADTLEDLLTDKTVPSATRANIAKDLLDRAGHKPVERKEVLGALLTTDVLNDLKQQYERTKYGPVKDVEDTVEEAEYAPVETPTVNGGTHEGPSKTEAALEELRAGRI